ncbi:sulfite reductase subunit alpha [Methyloceanibacter sp. wino2]|uniref:sulfite reductase subunit alpha n=1 Tax=Methyloceanibacter sp. wino2 TaxID=2170729 RepID=UPI000D3E434A|nr:sulfite reductase subunit alpha [Methyloceanibacter sp. wino2]
MTIQQPTPQTPLIPESAPFNEDQRAWLNGFFAGLMSLDPGVGVAPAGAVSIPGEDGDDGEAPWHDPAMPIDERMALAEGRPLNRRMMAAMAQQDCGQCGSSCEEYSNSIAEQAEPRLNLCVPGGKATARMLKSLVEEMGGGVIDPEEQAAKDAAKVPKSADQRPGHSRENPVAATFVSRVRLNGEGSEKVTNHIDIDLSESGLDYVVGDSLGVYAANDPALADAIIEAIGVPADFPILGKTFRDVLIEDTSLSPAPDELFQLISYLTGGERRRKAQALAKGEDPDGDAETLDVLEALQKFPGIHPDPEAFIEALEPLQPRLYSISSSPKAEPGKVSLTVDAVRYILRDRRREGLASTYLDARIAPGDALKVYVQKAHGFALPGDGATPIIMVGPGTGVAPFRAFLQERLATKADGGAWLFYGHQRSACDFFYKDELEGLQNAGALSRLSLAWSRDGGEKVYVQNKMREQGEELYAWLERGAHFYICGDAQRMAKDVESALTDIVAEHGKLSLEDAKAYVETLRASGRYQTDVY